MTVTESMTAIEANRRKFVAALRSGRYTKIRGAYFSEDTLNACCAAGVAAREFGLDPGHYPLLSVPIAEMLGIRPMSEQFTQIFRWNDDDDLSFSEIADRLETEWALA